jgi:hypothetical protein
MTHDDEKTVPCETCGLDTTKTGTKRCDWCWTVENLLDGYLQRGGRNAQNVLVNALSRAGATTVREAQVRAVQFVRNLTPVSIDRVTGDLRDGKVHL